MSGKFGFKKEDAMPFLKQTFTNIINNTDNALTGPIPRNDKQTLLSDLQALKKDNYFKIFKAFIETHIPEIKNENRPWLYN